MKGLLITTIIILSLSGFSQEVSDMLKVNQLGYMVNGPKWAYVSDNEPLSLDEWEIISSTIDTVVFRGNGFRAYEFDASTDEYVYRLDFSVLNDTGSYYLHINGIGSSYEFEISEFPYNEAFKKIMKGFYYQRSGVELTEEYAGKWARPAEYAEDAFAYLGYENYHVQFGEHVSTSGGWRDAGDANKKVVPAAIAIHFMMQLYEYFPDEVARASWNIPDDPDMDMPDILKEIKTTTDWLLSMQRMDGAVWHAVTLEHHFLTDMGHLDPSPRYLMPVSTTATADFAATMAQAFRIFSDVNQVYADSCLSAAEHAWLALGTDTIWNNPTIKGESGKLQYPELHGYSKDPPGINNTANYTDTNDIDEILWAASELYISTKAELYKTYFDNHMVTGMYYGSGWSRVANLANFSYVMAFRDQPDPTASTLMSSIRIFADIIMDNLHLTGFGTCLRPEDYYWGSNILSGHYAYSFIMAYEILGDEQYRDAALSLVNYLFGANSLNKVFLTGEGENRVENIFHLPSRFDGIDEVVPGLIPGGPNQYPQEWDIPHSQLIANDNPPPAKCYIDSEYSYASNETSVNENSVWAFVTGYFFKFQQSSTVHLTQRHNESPFRFYPNPASSEIHVHFHGESGYRVLDITGRNMVQGQMTDKLKLDVSDWRPGVYFINIQTDSHTRSARFLVM